MAKTTLKNRDAHLYHIQDEAESISHFGEAYVNQFGIELPDDLIKRYKANLEESKLIQAEISRHLHASKKQP